MDAGVVQRSWRTVGRGMEYRSGAGKGGEWRAVGQHPYRRVTLGDGDLEASPRYSLSGDSRPPELARAMMIEEIRETARVVWMGVRHHERVDAEDLP